MPLSRRERRILLDIEADLIKDDPEFARRMSATELDDEISPHRLVMIALVILGVCILLPLLLSTFTSPAACVTSGTNSSAGTTTAAPPVPAERTGPAAGEQRGRGERWADRSGWAPADADREGPAKGERVVCR